MGHGPSGCKSYRAYCPFYQENFKNKIICEGIVPDSTITLEFKQPAERKQQMRIFCNTESCKRCEIYNAIMEARYVAELEELRPEGSD